MPTSAYAADLCSAALVRLGDRPLASLDEDTDKARMCRHVYPITRDALLRDHPWSCAVGRALLEASGDAPAFGFRYRLPLPPDFLRLLGVAGAGMGAGVGAGAGSGGAVAASRVGVTYVIEGRAILANTAPLAIRYVAGGDTADESRWDAGFRHALTLALAAELAYPVTQSAALMQGFQAQLREVLKRARAVNGVEQPTPRLAYDSPLLAVHDGHGTGPGAGEGGDGSGPGPGAWYQRQWQITPEAG